MAGHNKWTKIKHKKATEDEGRGKLFSKLANNIAIAARGNPDPQFNPSLRSAIEQAKKNNMPQANIERAISKANESNAGEELLIEVYGAEGIGILVKAATDNSNRTISEIKVILKTHDAKLAEPGSLAWAFEKTPDGYAPKFKSPASTEAVEKIAKLIEALDNHNDVQEVYSSLQS